LRRLDHVAVVGTAALALLLTGCGQSGNDAAQRPQRAAAAAPSRTAEQKITRAEVVDDLHFAARGFGKLTVAPVPAGLKKDCHVNAIASTPKVLGKTEAAVMTRRLEERGWKADGSADLDVAAFLSSEGWDVIIGAGPVPEEVKHLVTPDKGAINLTATCATP
jgi:hypothetical protein